MELQKETKKDSALHGRWYGDACGTAFAMEIVGERWSLLVVRELMLGGRRFSDLRSRLPGVSAKVLTERLARLEEAGVLARRRLPPPVSAQVYELTEWGLLAEPAIRELGRWAARSPQHDQTLPLTPVGLMISLRTMGDPVGIASFPATVGFELDGEEFVASPGATMLEIRRGDLTEAALVFRAAGAEPLAALFYGKVPASDLIRQGALAIQGDAGLAERFAALFALPDKIG